MQSCSTSPPSRPPSLRMTHSTLTTRSNGEATARRAVAVVGTEVLRA